MNTNAQSFQTPLESVPCPFCGEHNNTILFSAKDLLHGLPGSFGIARCLRCSGIFTNPRPPAHKLLEYYPKDYAPHREREPIDGRASLFRKILGKVFHWYMTSFDTIDIQRGNRLLDLGCATGEYLHAQRKYGGELFGIEFVESAAALARRQYGLKVFVGTLEEAGFEAEFFDGVTGWMFLEHVPSPRQTLQEIHRILKPNGSLAFSVPNAGSWEFSFFRDRWFALQAPTHLTHFTPATAKAILAQTGFTVERIWHQVNIDNIVASTGYSLRHLRGITRIANWLADFPNNNSTIARFVVRPLLQPVAWMFSLLRQSGRMTILARKSR